MFSCRLFLVFFTLKNSFLSNLLVIKAGATSRDRLGSVAKDVCDALGYDQTHKAVKRHVEEGDGTKRPTPTTSGIQLMLFINESGHWRISRKSGFCASLRSVLLERAQ